MLRLLLSDNQKTNLGNIRNVQRILWFTWPKHNNPINLYRAAFYLPNFFMNIYIYLCVYYYIKNFKNIYLNSFWFIFDFEIFFSVSSMLIYGPIFTLYEYCGGGCMKIRHYRVLGFSSQLVGKLQYWGFFFLEILGVGLPSLINHATYLVFSLVFSYTAEKIQPASAYHWCFNFCNDDSIKYCYMNMLQSRSLYVMSVLT